MKQKRYVKLNEAEYQKRLRDSKRVEQLKPLIKKANDILKHTKKIESKTIN